MKLKHDKLLSNFAFNFNLRPYTMRFKGKIVVHSHVYEYNNATPKKTPYLGARMRPWPSLSDCCMTSHVCSLSDCWMTSHVCVAVVSGAARLFSIFSRHVFQLDVP